MGSPAQPLASGNLNEFQVPGLDEKTRDAAIEAVRRAVFDARYRTVWFLDKALTYTEEWIVSASRRLAHPQRWGWTHERCVEDLRDALAQESALMEEMLLRGGL